MPGALVFEEVFDCFSDRHLMLGFALRRVRTLFDLSNFFLGSFPTARLGTFTNFLSAEHTADPFGAAAAVPETILAVGAICGVPGVDKQPIMTGRNVSEYAGSVKWRYNIQLADSTMFSKGVKRHKFIFGGTNWYSNNRHAPTAKKSSCGIRTIAFQDAA
jgi:hypothetical protein